MASLHSPALGWSTRAAVRLQPIVKRSKVFLFDLFRHFRHIPSRLHQAANSLSRVACSIEQPHFRRGVAPCAAANRQDLTTFAVVMETRPGIPAGDALSCKED